MDKYVWEGIQIFLIYDDLVSLPLASKFHASCEWFGLGWKGVLSPMVTSFRRPFADDL